MDTAKEIADLNLSYLLLAQKMLRQDRPGAMLRLGVTEDTADVLAGMSLPETISIAASRFLLCAARLQELPVARLVQDKRATSLQQAHVSIVLASEQARLAAGAHTDRQATASRR